LALLCKTNTGESNQNRRALCRGLGEMPNESIGMEEVISKKRMGNRHI
jgi:hypothetical protein